MNNESSPGYVLGFRFTSSVAIFYESMKSKLFSRLLLLSLFMCLVVPPIPVMAQPPKKPASPVVVEKVILKEVQPIVTLIGTAKPHRRSVTAAQIEGLVVDLPVRKGRLF